MNGILKGSYYGTMSDVVSVTVRGGEGEGNGKPRLRTLIEYKEESWLGKPRFALEGVIYRSTEEEGEEYKKVKSVPSDKVVAHIEGNWMRQIKYRMKGEKVSHWHSIAVHHLTAMGFQTKLTPQEWKILLNLDELALIPKLVRPLSEQDAQESRKLWDPVTSNLIAKNWGEATKQKQVIEQRQRDKAAAMKAKGET